MKEKNLKFTGSKKSPNLPVWNLGDLYHSSSSQKLRKDLNFIRNETKRFEKKFQNKIDKLTSTKLYAAIYELEKIDEKIDKVISYSHLLLSENINNETNKIFFQKIQEKITNYYSSIIFFTLELNNINEKKINTLLKNKSLVKYKTWIENKRNFQPHQLDVNMEKILQDKSLTSHNAWVRLFDETIASLEFPYKNKKLTSPEILNLLSDDKKYNRKVAAKSIGNTLGKNINLFTSITNTLAKDKSINDYWRKFPNPVSSRNLSNVVEDEVVESLASSVIGSYPNLSHRYYKLKSKWFGQKKLKYWDRNAPLPFQIKKNYSWKEAKEIVLSSYCEFNPIIGNVAKKFFDNDWIHARLQTGKSPGAFSASTVPSVHPYILLNYQGKARDVSTLAHELGHGVHQYLAAKNCGHFNSSTPLTLAETASVFGEMLTFKTILNNSSNKNEKKALLANKVEDMLNTVIRQISFYEFEKKVHYQRKKSELSSDQICKIWLDVQKNSLGPAIEFEEEYKYYWTYIPHFIHSPFYVYAYAFGDCLVNSLYSVYENGLPNFESKYIKLLESGGSLRYRQLLKPFNLDPYKSNFWKKGLNVIGKLIDQLESI